MSIRAKHYSSTLTETWELLWLLRQLEIVSAEQLEAPFAARLVQQLECSGLSRYRGRKKEVCA